MIEEEDVSGGSRRRINPYSGSAAAFVEAVTAEDLLRCSGIRICGGDSRN